MAGLKRLLSSRCTAFERELLQAGATERPPFKTQRRMAGALGVSPLVFYVSAARALVGSTLLKAGFGVVVCAGMLGTTLRGASPALDEPHLADSVSVASPATQAPRALPVETPPAPTAAFGPSASLDTSTPLRASNARGAHPGPERVAGPERSRTPAPSRNLAEEVSLLDGARSLIRSGRHERALRRLDEYRRRFPSGILARESELLRGRLSL